MFWVLLHSELLCLKGSVHFKLEYSCKRRPKIWLAMCFHYWQLIGWSETMAHSVRPMPSLDMHSRFRMTVFHRCLEYGTQNFGNIHYNIIIDCLLNMKNCLALISVGLQIKFKFLNHMIFLTCDWSSGLIRPATKAVLTETPTSLLTHMYTSSSPYVHTHMHTMIDTVYNMFRWDIFPPFLW